MNKNKVKICKNTFFCFVLILLQTKNIFDKKLKKELVAGSENLRISFILFFLF